MSLVVPVVDDAGGSFVLKLQWPHRESEHEAAALAVWGGNGAVRLERWDSDRHALLLERCEPGGRLSTATIEEAIDAYVDLIPRLAIPVPATNPFTTLADEAATWLSSIEREWNEAGRPFERSLLDHVARLLDRLPSTQGVQVLVHQDMHSDNVLRSTRHPWLAVDPKPLVGEREFMVGGILRSFDVSHDGPAGGLYAFGAPHDESSLLRRFDEVVARTGVDRDRARDWAVAHFIAWCFDSAYIDTHVQSARWLLDA